MDETTPQRRRLGEVVALFLRLGVTAFGGPAAHIAMMHREVVERRGWIDNDRFLDLIGATNLIPGPNSTEMTMHVGHHRAGWRGLVAGGVAFILPAALIVTAIAVLYVEYGATPTGQALLSGIEPVIVAIVAVAVVKLAVATLRSPAPAMVAVTATALYLVGWNEIAILFGGAAGVWVLRSLRSQGGAPLVLAPLVEGGVDAVRLFWSFLKIGSVLYGGGYVLLAFVRAEFVAGLGVLSEQQLLDAVAVGQFTPGPLFTTATFVGYLLGGYGGAFVATVGIFAPGFGFVALLTRLLPHLRRMTWTGWLLDGVNASALGLMAGVLLELGREAVTSPLAVAATLVSLIVLLRTKLNSAWLVTAGGVVGLVAG
jgi:chromate transporter